MSKGTEARLTDWEQNIPGLIQFFATDLEFLLVLERLESLSPEDAFLGDKLLKQARDLNQANHSYELDEQTFGQNVLEGIDFIHGNKFDDYKSQFERYINSD